MCSKQNRYKHFFYIQYIFLLILYHMVKHTKCVFVTNNFVCSLSWTQTSSFQNLLFQSLFDSTIQFYYKPGIPFLSTIFFYYFHLLASLISFTYELYDYICILLSVHEIKNPEQQFNLNIGFIFPFQVSATQG